MNKINKFLNFLCLIFCGLFFSTLSADAVNISENIVDEKSLQTDINKNFLQLKKEIDIAKMQLFVCSIITERENIFYTKNDVWKSYEYKTKRGVLNTAAIISTFEKKKKYNIEEYLFPQNELPKTKIYSLETGQLLAEYVEKSKFKKYCFYDVDENYQLKTRAETTSEFMVRVHRKIKFNWSPSGKVFDRNLKTIVLFKILSDGTVLNPIIETSSGNKNFDELAIKTLLDLGKIEPLPKDIIEKRMNEIELKFTFVYEL